MMTPRLMVSVADGGPPAKRIWPVPRKEPVALANIPLPPVIRKFWMLSMTPIRPTFDSNSVWVPLSVSPPTKLKVNSPS